MQAMHFFFGGGALLSPLVTSFALEFADGDVRLALYVQAAVCIPAAGFFGLTSSPRAPPTEEHDDQHDPTAGSAPSARQRKQTIVAIFVSTFLALAVGAEVGFGGWLSTYCIRRYQTSETLGAIVTSAYWGSFTFGRLMGIPLSSRFTPRAMLLGDLVLGVFGSLLMVASWSLWMLWAGSCCLGLAIATMFPSCVSLPPSLGLPVSGSLTSMFVIGSSLGEMIVPFGIGAAIDAFGPSALNWCMLSVLLIGCVLLGSLSVMFGRSPGKTMTIKGPSGEEAKGLTDPSAFDEPDFDPVVVNRSRPSDTGIAMVDIGDGDIA